MPLPLRHLLALALSVLVLDQGTKYLAVSHLTSALEGREGLVARLVGFYTLHNLDNVPPEPGGADRVAERRVEGVGGGWHHRYVENEGSAADALSGLPEGLRRPLQHASALLALLFLLGWGARLPRGQRAVARALGLVLGGAVGNFADRLLRGYVIDFIDWHWGSGPVLQWPTFNLADVAIASGVSLLVLEALAVGRAVPARAPSLSRPV